MGAPGGTTADTCLRIRTKLPENAAGTSATAGWAACDEPDAAAAAAAALARLSSTKLSIERNFQACAKQATETEPRSCAAVLLNVHDVRT
eukprot:1871119-Pyramimonas_sp.AAC.1